MQRKLSMIIASLLIMVCSGCSTETEQSETAAISDSENTAETQKIITACQELGRR
ncbi:MAG: hypothetical protein K2K02_06865 [Ruminococcus sp.]|nr:hypothetical protein [Ruminococcus sp.]